MLAMETILDGVDIEPLITRRRWDYGRQYRAGDELIPLPALLPQLGVPCVRHLNIDTLSKRVQQLLRFDVLLGTLPMDAGTLVLSFLNDRDRYFLMHVGWNMRSFVWERVGEGKHIDWIPPVTEVRYNPRMVASRTIFNRARELEIHWRRKLHVLTVDIVNVDGFCVGQMVEIVYDNISEYVGKLGIVVGVLKRCVRLVVGSLWAEDLDIIFLDNWQVVLSTGTANEMARYWIRYGRG